MTHIHSILPRWGWLLVGLLLVACQLAPSTPAVSTTIPIAQTLTPAEFSNLQTSVTTPVSEVTPALSRETPTAIVPPPTATLEPGLPTRTPLPSPTAAIPPLPLPTPGPLVDFYEIKPGDTLGGISWAYGVPLQDILALNNFESDSVIIRVGQQIRVPLSLERVAPTITLLPDSEVVYSPAYVDFNTTGFLQQQGGYLATYREQVNGDERSGAEIIDLVAQQFGVGPRVLLAALEYYGGWVTQAAPAAEAPAGVANPYGDRLYLQLGWIANRLNAGYYGYKQQGQLPIAFRDRSRALVPPGLNAGSVAVYNLLALNTDWDSWQQAIRAEGFMQTYQRLFGDPFAYAIEPIVPYNLQQPELRLPWQSGVTFYYTGGPHGAYSDGSIGAAIDFGPPDVLGNCFYSNEYVTAAAEGRVYLGETGEIYLDLDFDGHLQTGWVLFYLHVVALDELQAGQVIPAGSPLGYASCEGGLANASHLHLARRYNGEWLAAGGPVPLVLSGWQVEDGASPYEGSLVRDGVRKVAGQFWDEELNAVVAE